MSLGQYYSRDAADDTPFSSWAYLIDLCRIAGEIIIPLSGFQEAIPPDAIDRADSKLVHWLLSLPKWKQELVDQDGVVDMVLFHAIGFAHA